MYSWSSFIMSPHLICHLLSSSTASNISCLEDSTLLSFTDAARSTADVGASYTGKIYPFQQIKRWVKGGRGAPWPFSLVSPIQICRWRSSSMATRNDWLVTAVPWLLMTVVSQLLMDIVMHLLITKEQQVVFSSVCQRGISWPSSSTATRSSWLRIAVLQLLMK